MFMRFFLTSLAIPLCRCPILLVGQWQPHQWQRCRRSPMSLLTQNGRQIFIHLQCWEMLPFLTIQRQRCIKILCPKDPEFYTPLALNRHKGRHLPALEVYKISLPQNSCATLKNLLMGLILMGCFPGDFREGKRPIEAFGERHSGKRPENGPLSTGNGPLWLMGSFRTPRHGGKRPLSKGPLRGLFRCPRFFRFVPIFQECFEVIFRRQPLEVEITSNRKMPLKMEMLPLF